MPYELWTIGHSTRTLSDFLGILQAHEIRSLVDVRRYPVSRRYPHFDAETLQGELTRSGVEYRGMIGLGGRRSPQPDSVNLGWRNDSFRGYADYMQTEDFQQALEDLFSLAAQTRTAIMCAEAVPWRCHRSLIADACVHRGWSVHHILKRDKTDAHALCAFAQGDGGRLTYPASDPPTNRPRLF